MRLAAVLLIVVLVGAVLGGCGDSSTSSAGTSSASGAGKTGSETGTGQAPAGSDTSSADGAADLTKAQFIRRADAICIRQSESFIEPLAIYMQGHASDSKSEAELAADAVRKLVLPKFQAQVDEIRDLGAPGKDKARIDAFLTSMQQAVDSLEKRKELALGTDVDAAFKHAGQLAHSYGLESCL